MDIPWRRVEPWPRRRHHSVGTSRCCYNIIDTGLRLFEFGRARRYGYGLAAFVAALAMEVQLALARDRDRPKPHASEQDLPGKALPR